MMLHKLLLTTLILSLSFSVMAKRPWYKGYFTTDNKVSARGVLSLNAGDKLTLKFHAREKTDMAESTVHAVLRSTKTRTTPAGHGLAVKCPTAGRNYVIYATFSRTTRSLEPVCTVDTSRLPKGSYYLTYEVYSRYDYSDDFSPGYPVLEESGKTFQFVIK